MIGIVVSREDEASVAIGEALLERGDWQSREDVARPDADGGGVYHVRDGFELRSFDDLHLYLEAVADAFRGPDQEQSPDLVVFVSRHAGETGPLLTAHFTGNVGPAEYGGRPNALARAAPNAQAHVVEALERLAPEDYDVGVECTHHGPTDVGAPSLFVEVGSAEPQWRDADAAEAVARAVLELEGVPADHERTVVGFGGGHYAPRFRRILRETDWAVGHVLAGWGLEAARQAGAGAPGGLPPAVLEAAFEESATMRAVVDGEWPALVEAIEERGYEVVSETWLRETVGVPLELVAEAEAALCSVEAGLRFGDRRAEEVAVDRVNPDLVGAALGADAAATVEAFRAGVVAYETAEAGNRPTGWACLPVDGSLDSLVEGLADVLRSAGAEVERDGEDLVVTESRFDPALARERGVPEGPAFGRLAGGEAVEVDGETVTPESVHTERTRRYPIRPDGA